jgi:hypothetical protein
MKEIIGSIELENAFKDLNIESKRTYLSSDYDDNDFQGVWEISDEDFEKICGFEDIPWYHYDDEESEEKYNNNPKYWKESWGWWRHAEGSNMGLVDRKYNINHHYIYAWDGYSRFKEENFKGCFKPRKYDDLLQYFCNELGASTEKNVCALATDLAEYNNMTMGELFTKYQG